MDPIITPIVTGLAVSLTQKGLKELIKQLFPDFEFADDKKMNEIRDGLNVLRTKEFKAAADWLKQASIRSSTDAARCMWEAEVQGKLAINSVTNIQMRVQAYGICILAGYYNASDGGRSLSTGKQTAIDYLNSLKNDMAAHFHNMTAEEIKAKVRKKLQKQLTGGSALGWSLLLPFIMPVVMLILLTAITAGATIKEVREKIFTSAFIPGGLKERVANAIEHYVKSNTELKDKLYCDREFAELQTAITNLPEGE
jgi:hypothetical protein